MRDYAEIGWRLQGDGQRLRPAASRVAAVWSAATSPGATVVLVLVIAGLFVLDATGAGTTLPIEDSTRLAPFGLRAMTGLLAVQLLAALLGRALPNWLLRRAQADDLALHANVEVRASVPFAEDDLSLERGLQEGGVVAARSVGRRRGFGVLGRLGLAGAVVSVAGALSLLTMVVMGVDDPAAGRLVLGEGETAEAVHYGVAGVQELDVFAGYSFRLDDSVRLAGGIQGGMKDAGPATLTVTNLIDGKMDRMPLTPESRIGMPDGTVLRVRSIRPIATPAAAVLTIAPPNGAPSWSQRVLVGSRLELGTEAGLTVVALEKSYPGASGPGVQVRDDEGETFWFLQGAGDLVSARPAVAGNLVEVKELERGFEIIIERVVPQQGALVMLGLLLLLVGAAMLYASRHVSIEVIDEIDRVVVRGSSVNDMAGVGAVLRRVASSLQQLAEQQASARTEAPALPAAETGGDEEPEENSESEEGELRDSEDDAHSPGDDDEPADDPEELAEDDSEEPAGEAGDEAEGSQDEDPDTTSDEEGQG